MANKTITEIDRQIEILNSFFNADKFQFKRSSGQIHLMANGMSKDISLGNTKTELYYQLLTVNKVLEELKNEIKEKYERKVKWLISEDKNESDQYIQGRIGELTELLEELS